MYTRAEAKFYSSLDPRDPDYLDMEPEQDEGEPDEWVDEREADFVMTEAEKRGEL